MKPSRAPAPASSIHTRPSHFELLVSAAVLAIALIVRLIPASRLFLNPDEALHYLLASQSSLRQAWAAALTNAHPPLLILLLYFWRSFGHSELWLRLPSVLAGTAACWFVYLWLRAVAGRAAALLGLLLFSFSPSLILLSAEVRQYAILLFFMAACLYLSERALRDNSPAVVALFSVSLWGALLTHYSALIFALTMGVYLLIRLYPYRSRPALFAAWAAGQIVALTIAVYFLTTHIPRLRETGMVRADLESYLRKAVFHPGDRNPVEFLASQTLRVFTYVFSHGLIGALMLLAFLWGLALLARNRFSRSSEPESEDASDPSSRSFLLLLVLPFLISWAVALAGFYPLGATRHDAFLAPFLVAASAIGVAGLTRDYRWIKLLVVVFLLVICNFFPAPPPPIRPADQSRQWMAKATHYLHSSSPAGSILLTDYESGLLLGYYFCGHGVVQVFPPLQPLSRADCGNHTVLSTSFQEWKFAADTFPEELARATQEITAGPSIGQSVNPNKEIWLFYAGWINDSAPAMKKRLAILGCASPQQFGANILICRLTPSASASNAINKKPPSQEGGLSEEGK